MEGTSIESTTTKNIFKKDDKITVPKRKYKATPKNVHYSIVNPHTGRLIFNSEFYLDRIIQKRMK